MSIFNFKINFLFTAQISTTFFRASKRMSSSSLRKANWKGFKDDCKRLLTEDIITDDVTTSCNHVVGAIVQAAEKNVQVFKPSKNPTRKPVPHWTDECTAAVKERNMVTRDLTEWKACYRQKGIAQRVDKDAMKRHRLDFCLRR